MERPGGLPSPRGKGQFERRDVVLADERSESVGNERAMVHCAATLTASVPASAFARTRKARDTDREWIARVGSPDRATVLAAQTQTRIRLFLRRTTSTVTARHSVRGRLTSLRKAELLRAIARAAVPPRARVVASSGSKQEGIDVSPFSVTDGSCSRPHVHLWQRGSHGRVHVRSRCPPHESLAPAPPHQRFSHRQHNTAGSCQHSALLSRSRAPIRLEVVWRGPPAHETADAGAQLARLIPLCGALVTLRPGCSSDYSHASP